MNNPETGKLSDTVTHLATSGSLPEHIGFVGTGNMATAIMGGLLAAGYQPDQISGGDPSDSAREQWAARGITALSADAAEVIAEADLVILAVKPQVMQAVTHSLRGTLKQDAVVMSIAAGVTVKALQEMFENPELRVVRCMPNTPALIGLGASGLFASRAVSPEQKKQVGSVMEVVGTAFWLEQESQIDAVTAVSGSGPAYFFAFIEAMIKAGEKLGLEQAIATQLTLQTALGAASLAKNSHESIDILRKNVTSPGGTTARALDSFDRAGLSKVVSQAMEACFDRAVEMSEEYK
jgi:pyrroline-5-carboxylate reductase